jgi:hypothetical protein
MGKDRKRSEKMGKDGEIIEIHGGFVQEHHLLGKSPLNKIMVDFSGFAMELLAGPQILHLFGACEEHCEMKNMQNRQISGDHSQLFLSTFGGEAGEISVKCQMSPTKAGVLIIR